MTGMEEEPRLVPMLLVLAFRSSAMAMELLRLTDLSISVVAFCMLDLSMSAVEPPDGGLPIEIWFGILVEPANSGL